jgi:biotin carboxyl carrier protein
MKTFRVRVNGNEYEVEIEEIIGSPAGHQISSPPPPRHRPDSKSAGETVRQAAAPPTSSGGTELIAAPMPGTILDVRVQQGNSVSKGQTLMILEAMKMENEILAPRDCTVTEIHAVKGTSVNAGDPLIVLA